MYGESHDTPTLLLMSEQTGSSLMFLGKSTVLLQNYSPSLLLIDSTGNTEVGAAYVRTHDTDNFIAALGRMDTANPKTGAATKTSAASLILFGKDGKSIYQVP